MNGYGIFVVPLSWAFGRWDRGPYLVDSQGKVHYKKSLWALGPFRFVLCHNLDPWKEDV